MSKPSDAGVQEISGTWCTYVQREGGVHYIRFRTPNSLAIHEMVMHLKTIGEHAANEETNRIFVDSSVFRSPNIAAIFREVRSMDRTVPRRAKGRLALIVTTTLFNTLINMLSNTLMRSGDKFQIFGTMEIEKAEAWLKSDS